MPRDPLAFVLMPFGRDFDEIYENLVKPTLEGVGYEVRRADDILNQRNILRDIVEKIAECDLVIADLTGLNANVFYELGIAHATDRPTILLTQDVAELPFDLRSYRVIAYSTHFARVEAVTERLRETATGARDGTLQFGNPFTDFVQASASSAETPELAEPTAEENHPGWLDHLEALESGYVKLSEVLESLTTAIQSIGKDATSSTERMKRAQTTAGPGTASAMRAIATEFGGRLSNFSEDLAHGNSRYEEVLREIENSAEVIINRATVNDEAERQSLQRYLNVLAAVRDSASEAKSTIAGMRQTVRGLEDIERTSTRAARDAGAQLDRLINNLERTIASTDRGIEVGKRKLETPS